MVGALAVVEHSRHGPYGRRSVPKRDGCKDRALPTSVLDVLPVA